VGSGDSSHLGHGFRFRAAEETKAKADRAEILDYFAGVMDFPNHQDFVADLQTVLQETRPWRPPEPFVFGRSPRDAAAESGAGMAGPRRGRKRGVCSSRPKTDSELYIPGIREHALNLPGKDRRAFVEALTPEDRCALEEHQQSRAADRDLAASASRRHPTPKDGNWPPDPDSDLDSASCDDYEDDWG